MEEKKRVKADFNLRKANEGSDTSQWDGSSVYRKPGKISDDEDEDEEYEEVWILLPNWLTKQL